MRILPLVCTLGSAWALLATATLRAENAGPVFRAGVATVDITPQTFPRIIAGSFLENRASKVTDPLHVRCFVLDDGKMKIAFAIVDTCMMPQSLIDEAKGIASKASGIPMDRMMVSATHTHSAPAAMGCLGTRLDKEYADMLTQKIAEGIVAANKALQPARIGWGSVDDWEHTHNRRWIRLPGKEVVDPFGQPTGRANMHPGYLSKDVVGPSGPVDPQLSVIALKTLDGKPLGVLANYSQHYFGATAVSADYYGLFCKHLAAKMGQSGDGNGTFVCAMSQGTSGDLMWMDYGAEKKNLTLDTYAAAVADNAMKALKTVTYHQHVPLAMVEKTLELAYRVPDEKRLAWARPIAAKIENDVPKDKPEVYAREALILHERQKTVVKLQAIRIGDLSIATLPNEVYAITGLKLRKLSPSKMHFNIELANGAEGYIPPPEQHALGGYTTWPARTAGLEVQAEPKMVETLLGALEEATEKGRRLMRDDHGPYARAILEAKPAAYWRMSEIAGDELQNAMTGGEPAKLTPGVALYLPGVGSGSGTGAGEALTPSAFSGPQQINRAVHFAGGAMETKMESIGNSYTIALWCWLGERSGASDRQGDLIHAPGQEILRCEQLVDHRVCFSVGHAEFTSDMRADDWHFVVLVREGPRVRVHINGRDKPDLDTAPGHVPSEIPGAQVAFGRGVQGKLDEVAIFKRALQGTEIASLWRQSGMAAEHARSAMKHAKQREEEVRKQQNAPSHAALITFGKEYPAAISALRPRFAQVTHGIAEPGHPATGKINPYTRTDLPGTPPLTMPLGKNWSVSLWLRNDMAHDARPVTAYLVSRGPEGDAKAPGDHLGIGGSYKNAYAGKLIVFNGNESNQVVSGQTTLAPGTWNHVVFVRDGSRVRVWLNGADKPEIDAEIPVTATGVDTLFLGKRSDNFAPLQGMLTQFALFDRSLAAEEAKTLFTASGQSIVAPNPTTNIPSSSTSQLSSPPLSPEESAKKWHVREGYRIELVAAEPLVLDPVAFDWDGKGRLWVVEMADYPLGMDGKGKAGGRVVILEDTNDDAKYDKRTLVADGLNFPTGILTWRDGAIVTAAPDVLYLGPTGEKKVLLTGFSTGNQQLRVNGLRWGMDGWVYCAAGAHNAGYNKGTEITSVLTGEEITLGSRDFRFKPDTGEFDPQSGPSQFGRARDDWGHWFGVQNSFPLWHYVLQDHYLRRNPHVIPPDPIHQLFPRNPQVYPVSSMEKRFHSFGESGRFTSACGIEVYRDRVLFNDGKTHAFTCEPFHNVVQHHVLEDDGVSFKATRDPEEKRDFLASEDRWCRPVMVRTGPDGALWVADMYRYMIEHPQWLPQNGKDELLPHYREGDDKGRIWRVVREGGTGVSASVTDSVAVLQKAGRSVRAPFESQNGWVRDKAQMMLAWEPRKEVEEELRWVMTDGIGSRNPVTGAQAAWTLRQLGLLKAEDVLLLLTKGSTRVHEQALALAELHETPEIIKQGQQLWCSTDEKLVLQLASTIGMWKSENVAAALAMILKNHAGNASIRGAAMSSVLPHLTRVATIFAESPEAAHDALVADLFRCALSAKNDEAIAAILTHTKTRPRLAGLLEVLSARGLYLRAFPASMKSSAFHKQIQYAQEVLWQDLVATSTAMVMRDGANASLENLQLMAADFEKRGEFIGLLPGLWKGANAERASSLLGLIVKLQPKGAPEFLLANWGERTPALRSQIIETLLSNDGWTLALLERVKNKSVETNACDAATRARLLKHPNAKVKELAGAAFADSGSAARAAVLEKFRPALQFKGDAANGKTVFAQVCISCHKLDGVGLELGPDLRSVAQHDGEKLLNSILDPSAIIEPGFMAYHCALKNGEQLYGVIATETSTSLTLKLPGNVIRSVLRSDVASLKSTNTSLMPDGLEAVMTPQSLADLIAYLKMARE